MEEDFRNIQKILTRITDLQAHHVDSFERELMPDLEKQCIERNKEFVVLKKMINAFVSKSGVADDDEFCAKFEDLFPQIEVLIRQSRVLEKKVILHRNAIQKSIRGISRGKKVIRSYGASAGTSKGPKVLSLLN